MTTELLFGALAEADPFRWTWAPAPAVARGAAFLRRPLKRLRIRSLAEGHGRTMAGLIPMLDHVNRDRVISLFPAVPALSGRQPVVLAHGPSLAELIPVLRRKRDSIYLIAPLRTAQRLAESGLIADVTVLADATPFTYSSAHTSWRAVSASVRRALTLETTLLVEPFAPKAIHDDFAHVCVFDDGLDWLPEESRLPFWGSALLPSICLPLALGASTVAVGGMDMGASSGRRASTWSGLPMRVAPAMNGPLRLLETIAMAMPNCLVDLTSASVAKKGFEQLALEQLLERQSPQSRTALMAPGSRRGMSLLEHLVRSAELHECTTIAGMTDTATRLSALLESAPLSSGIHQLVGEMEDRWASDHVFRTSLELIEPELHYLRSFWQLKTAGFVARDADVAARMKAKLIAPEIAGLGPACERWVHAIRAAAERSSPV